MSLDAYLTPPDVDAPDCDACDECADECVCAEHDRSCDSCRTDNGCRCDAMEDERTGN